MTVSDELARRIQEYLDARRAQEQNHIDETLNWRRTEAHDALMIQMDIDGVHYEDREDAARIAQEIVNERYHDDPPPTRPCSAVAMTGHHELENGMVVSRHTRFWHVVHGGVNCGWACCICHPPPEGEDSVEIYEIPIEQEEA